MKVVRKAWYQRENTDSENKGLLYLSELSRRLERASNSTRLLDPVPMGSSSKSDDAKNPSCPCSLLDVPRAKYRISENGIYFGKSEGKQSLNVTSIGKVYGKLYQKDVARLLVLHAGTRVCKPRLSIA